MHNHRKHELELDRLVSLDRHMKLQSNDLVYISIGLFAITDEYMISESSARIPRVGKVLDAPVTHI